MNDRRKYHGEIYYQKGSFSLGRNKDDENKEGKTRSRVAIPGRATMRVQLFDQNIQEPRSFSAAAGPAFTSSRSLEDARFRGGRGRMQLASARYNDNVCRTASQRRATVHALHTAKGSFRRLFTVSSNTRTNDRCRKVEVKERGVGRTGVASRKHGRNIALPF